MSTTVSSGYQACILARYRAWLIRKDGIGARVAQSPHSPATSPIASRGVV
jgi:hypothetical protein